MIRTRTYLTADANHLEAARAHGEVFKDIRSASTMIMVSGFLDPRWLVGVEADALVDSVGRAGLEPATGGL